MAEFYLAGTVLAIVVSAIGFADALVFWPD